MTWSTAQIPDLSGRWAMVTGASSGLGHHVTRELARAGAAVVMAGRDLDRLAVSADLVRRGVPAADLHIVSLDLADLAAVHRTAEQVLEGYDHLDLLVDNAGVMATPERKTADGFELQIGTNHLGHFALTGLLLPALLASPHGARVVVTSSVAHRTVSGIDLDSLVAGADTRPYRKWRAYGESKLANLLFMLELERRAAAEDLALLSVAAHPGYAATELQTSGPAMGGSTVGSRLMSMANKVVAQPADHGAWPLLLAATQPGLPGGSYVGPGGPGETRGRPRLVGMSAAASDPGLA
ncbi:MAG: oxidoreductase, partial [Actinomycetota bacterium]|nr:oxidoreductase [Actinomycetota bacterium]